VATLRMIDPGMDAMMIAELLRQVKLAAACRSTKQRLTARET
jgi:hypothetical protein